MIGYIWPNTIHGLTLSNVDLMNDISGLKGEYRCPNPGEIDILVKTFRQAQIHFESRTIINE